MKYRRLSKEELKKLKQEFSDFLQTLDMDERKWATLNESQPTEADTLLDNFSEMVFDKALQAIRYLERKEPDQWEVLRVTDEGLEIITVQTLDTDKLDLTNPDCIRELSTYDPGVQSSLIRIAKSERKLEMPYRQEVFLLMESGFHAVDKNVFRSLESLYLASMGVKEPSDFS